MASLCLREADKIGDMEKGEILVHLSRIVVGGLRRKWIRIYRQPPS